ncbi:MAG: trigger factor [Thermosynechococcus sp.]|uniref:trigger factor n=1 Tax=Thermosynechococcus sp. TaxID=2814275 RepID=UPI00220C3164|nr:trigger factor [Thermosynechococcus sp.]BCX11709.1 MAG: trigger factor [Thermosynechococcus sp.]
MTDLIDLISVTTEPRSNSQLLAKIEVAGAHSQQVYNQVVNDLLRHTQVPGFRKGKAPRQLVLQQLGRERLHYLAMEKLIEDAVKTAVEKNNIPYLGNLELEGSIAELRDQFHPGENFSFSVTFDVEPEVTVTAYQGLTIEYSPVTYNPETVEQLLQRHQREHATLIPVEDRPAQWGDDVTLKLVTKDENGEVVKELSADELPLSLDAAQPFLLKEIPAAVVGMSIGELKTVTVSVAQEAAEGKAETPKPLTAEIELLGIKAPELPPLDDAFAAEHSEFSTMAELRAYLEQNHQERAKNQDKQAKEAALIDALIAQNPVELPKTLIRKEADVKVRTTLMQIQSQGVDLNKILTEELYEKMRQEAEPAAAKDVHARLLLKAIARQEGIEPSPEAVEERLNRYKEVVRNQTAKDLERLRELAHDEVQQEQVLNWLLEQNTFQPVQSDTATEQPPGTTGAPKDTQMEAVAENPSTPQKRSGKKASAAPSQE